MLRINFVTYKECLYKECHGTDTDTAGTGTAVHPADTGTAGADTAVHPADTGYSC